MTKLKDIEKKNPFKIPQLYFDGFPNLMAKKIDQTKPSVHLYDWKKPAIAAAILILILSVFALKILLSHDSPEKHQPLAANSAYIESNVDEATIINEIVTDSTFSTKKESVSIQESEDDLDLEAETVDYTTLLAEF